MDKSQLESGNHIVICRNGKEYLVAGDQLIGLLGQMNLSYYNRDLTHRRGNKEWDIIGVEEATFVHGFTSSMQNRLRKVLWSRTSFTMKKVPTVRRSDALIELEKCVDDSSQLYFSTNTTLAGQSFQDCVNILDKVTFDNVLSLWEAANGSFYIVVEVQG